MLTIHIKDKLKNNHVELTTDNVFIYIEAKKLFFNFLKVKYNELNYFLQGDSDNKNDYWLMFEAWSDNDDLFIESCIELSEKLNIQIQFA